MSTTNHPIETAFSDTDTDSDAPSFDCGAPDCDTNEPTDAGPIGAYCSPECSHRHHGRKLLNLLKHDHRFCYTCFRQIKRVDDVPEHKRRSLGRVTESAVTGYQTRTQHGELGEVAHPRSDNYGFETSMGTICECGNANTSEREDIIRESDIKTTVLELHRALTALRREGQHDHRIDIHDLIDVLHQQAQQGNDWDFPRAVGAAIEDQENA